MARSTGGRVLLRIEDHDRTRCRPAFDAAVHEDLAWLGFTVDEGPMRQSDPEALAAYADALARLRADGRVYGCDCTRSTFATWAEAHGRSWSGIGCPGGCRDLQRAMVERSRISGARHNDGQWGDLADVYASQRRSAGQLLLALSFRG